MIGLFLGFGRRLDKISDEVIGSRRWLSQIDCLLSPAPYSVEMLEKWTVGHVKTLEERMGDVERWLVDKEERDQRKDDKDNEADSTDVLSKKEGPKTEGPSQGRHGDVGTMFKIFEMKSSSCKAVLAKSDVRWQKLANQSGDRLSTAKSYWSKQLK
ncbi:hypothetical protein DFH05DRAFT_1596643 [Lentinula detonsa]|uniref:Uncharacterized protein n=1 Tax=Lentinula detonsa TaxID=2804962 RepID=A0A9W8NQV8_9AGAR|nr:hypothetical protein DFH05DRAFT_1596643 [Lentinula detonsa]KAJ3978584.1 hypothetical protein F5890DRAFT_1479237 [Lentinula detonsa]